MKKLFLALLFSILASFQAFAATEQDQNAANFLAEKGVITTSSDYKLDSNITRREMLKVMMNLTDSTLGKQCRGEFVDLVSTDWGCKYAEEALDRGFIAKNEKFRPDDFVTNIEALKMVMQARNIEPIYDLEYAKTTDWRKAYMLGASRGEKDILPETPSEWYRKTSGYTTFNVLKAEELYYNIPAIRSYIFLIASKSFDTFKVDNNIEDFLLYTDENNRLKFEHSYNNKVTTGNQVIQVVDKNGKNILNIYLSEGSEGELLQYAELYQKPGFALPVETKTGKDNILSGYISISTYGEEHIYIYNPYSSFFVDISYDKKDPDYLNSILPILESLEFGE